MRFKLQIELFNIIPVQSIKSMLMQVALAVVPFRLVAEGKRNAAPHAGLDDSSSCRGSKLE
jgi:hypothetical protein